eukprot:CAMPEP_0202687414 /NCGR_PEP_ID=MMETSP1385-20130828/3093_1 /ASSEMBLY_ACC=CAM_ASM_000861 /TAXON_ID=933848 /ORGANISM="Elphidium margaritaceum" /LENGTH=969 /DNA_ID=CAMNT_0049342197 /DNA_START=46 /DNA_END=2954 /DNA_ORIENTATION=-
MSGDAKYFQTTKKGEIRELQDDLNSVNKDKIKEAVKKVIAAMTVGKDVSMLFSDVIKSMGTDNIELKKLVYLYIINYARSQPEKAILVVNMFQKDATNHPNPLVRALAIRTMGCIRVDRITEYLCEPLNVALKDQDPYVRKTAAICVAKLYDINNELVEDRGFIDSLREMLSDVNPMVVANAVAALTEICEASGIDYFKIDSNTLSKLLTALNECTEWGRVFILDALSKFNAKGSQARDICDRVVPQLAHANSAVVMAAVKVVVKFLDILPKKEDVEKYCKKLAPPLVTLLSSPPEIQYVALRNIDLIVQKYPRILQNDIRIFFVKFNDAVYVKMQKLQILIKLTSRKNIDQVLLEFKEYAQEVDIDFVRRAVRAIGRVAIKLDCAAEKCVQVLSELVKTRVNYVVQESVIVIKDIFRRYPRKYEKIIVTLCDNLDSLNEPEAKASMIWIIGEYAERIVDAGDRLEHFIDSFEEEGSLVQLQLLTATVKLFLKKPDKAKSLVQKVLNLATESSDNPDLRDRGYVYWRLLSTDPTAARKVVLAERPVISSETFSLPEDYLSVLMENLSSLASVYHRPPEEFVRGSRKVVFMPYEEEDAEEEEDSDDESESDSDDDKAKKKKGRKDVKKGKKSTKKGKSSEDEEESDEEDEEDSEEESDDDDRRKKKKKAQLTPQQPAAAAAVQPPQQQQSAPVVDLMGMGDLLGITSSNPTPAQPQPVSATAGGGGGLDDLFGSFGVEPAAQQPAASSVPMTMVFDANKGQGLEMSIGFDRVNGTPTMVVQCSNKSGDGITRIDIKFNKNYLGIQPAQTLPLQGAINPGQSQTVNLGLLLNTDPMPKNPLDLTVQMAARSIRTGGGKPPVTMFAVQIPARIFFDSANANTLSDRNAFLAQWRSIDASLDQSQTVKQCKNTSTEAVKQIFVKNGCSFVADRSIQGKGVSLYFASTLKSVAVLLEISIANNGAVPSGGKVAE